MKKIIIISGPNGAGKTTFAMEFLPQEADCPEYVNADLIAAGISPFQPSQVAFAAGRMMLSRLAELVAAEKSFAFETTLSSQSWRRLIPQWQAAGYCIKLYYLQLPHADLAVQRVRHRVFLGGHDIPESVIRRRFTRSWENFQSYYRDLVDEWSLYDASDAPARLLATGTNPSDSKLMEDINEYESPDSRPALVKPLDDPDFIGAEAAFIRAGAKALALAKAAGIDPVVVKKDHPTAPNKKKP